MAGKNEGSPSWRRALDHLVQDLPLRIADERGRANLSVPEAAARVEMSPSYWHKLENGKVASPGIRCLLEVQYALGLESLEPLFGVPSGRRLSE